MIQEPKEKLYGPWGYIMAIFLVVVAIAAVVVIARDSTGDDADTVVTLPNGTVTTPPTEKNDLCLLETPLNDESYRILLDTLKPSFPEEPRGEGVQYPSVTSYWSIDDSSGVFDGRVSTYRNDKVGYNLNVENQAIWKIDFVSKEATRLTTDREFEYSLVGKTNDGNLIAYRNKLDEENFQIVIISPDDGRTISTIPTNGKNFVLNDDNTRVAAFTDKTVEIISLAGESGEIIYTAPSDSVIKHAHFVQKSSTLIRVDAAPVNVPARAPSQSIKSLVFDLERPGEDPKIIRCFV